MKVITNEQLELFYHTFLPKLDLSNIITIDDEDLTKVLHYFLILKEFGQEIAAGSSFTNEQILYSQYYWFVYFKNQYISKYGYDAGMDQQAFQLIEHIAYELHDDVNWDILEQITNDLKTDLELKTGNKMKRGIFMEQEGCVSLWVGEFGSSEKFRDYLFIEYDEDGEAIPSNFEKDFSIEYYDEDFREVVYHQQPHSSLNQLVAGASFEEVIIPKFQEMFAKNAPEKANAVVLLYNFHYNSTIKTAQSGLGTLHYIGAVQYK
ncbi:immunity 22 family protein [Bacillus sp. FJAT-27245]|uniref:immunity 22 family protein n=1 Tax=Bacillus sp. FJAT-27245 TaxID=1684144 RepID=UPI0006A78443|nr:immunity 22 family protein [Bacillus sp. FJAT-27245]